MSDRLSGRILSVDILRGITVCMMIIVNNPLSQPFAFLEHSGWNGLTPCDMVFPFFLFIMGVSIFLSLSKNGFERSWKTVLRILRRTAGIILVCYGIIFLSKLFGDRPIVWSDFRLTGVLVRIALCYGIVALLSLFVRKEHFFWIAPLLLVAYSVILLVWDGYAPDHSNILYRIDARLLGEAHLYQWEQIEPEGLLSTIPCIAHTMIGFLCGMLLKSGLTLEKKSARMALWGAALVVVGLIISIWLPINKKVWSPSFVLVTTGAAMALLALLTWVLDIKGWTRWSEFFRVFGVNALALYVIADLLGILLGPLGFWDVLGTFWTWAIPSNAHLASLGFSLTVMMICWLCGFTLYKSKIFIKL